MAAAWPAAPWVRALTTVRSGGTSRRPYESFNLASHVGDDPSAVARNREWLRALLNLPAEPAWLQQVHGTRVIHARQAGENIAADGSYADGPELVCAVLTADCLPVFLCDMPGTRIAVLHAGWRGLAAGIIESGIAALAIAPASLMAWLGPAIGPAAFEVGPEVREAFSGHDGAARIFFAESQGGRLHADLYGLARMRLARAGVGQVYGGGFCTVNDPDRFYSYRRDGACGRMASLIWLER
ncbi:MAG: peptidoglycan editing factor PgeF [Acidiferrobacterales bacterium]